MEFASAKPVLAEALIRLIAALVFSLIMPTLADIFGFAFETETDCSSGCKSKSYNKHKAILS
jgi:hypothetical protein